MNTNFHVKVVKVGPETNGSYGKYKLVTLKDTYSNKVTIFATASKINSFDALDDEIFSIENTIVERPVGRGIRIKINKGTVMTIVTEQNILTNFIGVHIGDFQTTSELIAVTNLTFYQACSMCNKKIADLSSTNCFSCKAELKEYPTKQEFYVNLHIEAAGHEDIEKDGKLEEEVNNKSLISILAFSRGLILGCVFVPEPSSFAV